MSFSFKKSRPFSLHCRKISYQPPPPFSSDDQQRKLHHFPSPSPSHPQISLPPHPQKDEHHPQVLHVPRGPSLQLFLTHCRSRPTHPGRSAPHTKHQAPPSVPKTQYSLRQCDTTLPGISQTHPPSHFFFSRSFPTRGDPNPYLLSPPSLTSPTLGPRGIVSPFPRTSPSLVL